MNSTIVTSKGTTTIPKEVRDILGIKPGSRINFEITGDEVRIRRNYSIDELRALNTKYIDKKMHNLSLEELREIASDNKVNELNKKFSIK